MQQVLSTRPQFIFLLIFFKSVSETSILVKGRTTILKTLHVMLHTMQSKKWISNIISHAEISQMYFQWKSYPQTSNIYDGKKIHTDTNVCKSTHMVQAVIFWGKLYFHIGYGQLSTQESTKPNMQRISMQIEMDGEMQSTV